MARMIPDRPVAGTESRAELRFFERLARGTSDGFVAFHSVSWLVPARRGAPRQGESDFVIAHPDHGVLTIEVKGGGIRFDATAGRWHSRGANEENEISDPVRQAQRSSHLLRASLARSLRGADAGIFGYGVAFPDTRIGAVRLKHDLPREIVIESEDLNNLESAIRRLFRYWEGAAPGPPIGTTGVGALERVLANSFEFRAPLAAALAEDDRELLELTEQQYAVLDLLSRQPRAAITGCAGSGKTFLMAEKARRLAAQGFHTVALVHGLFLAKHLKQGLADVANIDVFAIDELCELIVHGDSGPSQPERERGQDYYEQLHAAFADAVDRVSRRYDAMVVDEAQDVDPDLWVPLQLLLRDPDESPLYIFFDSNQRLFRIPEGLPVDDPPFVLTINCRNTKQINDAVMSYYAGEPVVARGPHGIPVDVHFYDDDEQLLDQLEEAVRSWIQEAQIAPSDIALLSTHAPGRSVLWRKDQIAGVGLTDDPWDAKKILRSTVHRFKGLERPVVAVTELDGAKERTLYVGFSRPSVFLAIFCPRRFAQRLPPQLRGK